jgi:hypothetical protein
MSELTKTEIKEIVRDEIKKCLAKELKDIDSQKVIKQIISDVLINFYKSLYQKSAIWSRDIK